jgi:toxin YoeB
LNYWLKKNKKTADKILRLIGEIEKTPFTGRGHPEPLKHEYSGFWSRRIDREYRLVYKIEDDTLFILSCRYHY